MEKTSLKDTQSQEKGKVEALQTKKAKAILLHLNR